MELRKFIKSPAWRRKSAVAMIALLIIPSISKADPLSPQSKTEPGIIKSTETGAASAVADNEEIQPKFIWGILIKFAASKVLDVFAEWTFKKMFAGMIPSLTIPSSSAKSAPGAALLAPASKGTAAIMPNVTDSVPATPLVVDGGKENYQGALLTLLVLQPDGQTLKVRAISEGFKSGEKFRIRIGATFEGELSLDNIDPKGERSRLYPEQTEKILKIKSGVPVILPLGRDDYFQFDDDTGEEKLVVTLRDPRAQNDAISLAKVNRKEYEQGTGLLQEVAAGKFAAIAESIELRHSK